jgi:choline dehydrogenase-like flavoprotein
VGNPVLDWGFKTVPQKNLNNNVLGLSRGRALGGTSAVNGMFFLRGCKPEYDAIEQLGNPGWNWANFTSHIKAFTTFTPAAPAFAEEFRAKDADHGTSGPLQVTFSTHVSLPPITKGFFSTMASLGVGPNEAPVRLPSIFAHSPMSNLHKSERRKLDWCLPHPYSY